MLPALFLFAAQFLQGQSEDLAGRSAQARQLMASGRFEEAIPVYRQIVKAEPGNPGCCSTWGWRSTWPATTGKPSPRWRPFSRLSPIPCPRDFPRHGWR